MAYTFKQYNDPKKAERIFESYKSDATKLASRTNSSYEEIQRKILDLVRSCNTCDDLDLKLDSLLGSPIHLVGNRSASLNSIDKDVDSSSWGDIVRVLEEDR